MAMFLSFNIFEKMSFEEKEQYLQTLKEERNNDDNFLSYVVEEKRKDWNYWQQYTMLYLTLMFGLISYANLTHSLFEISLAISIISFIIVLIIIVNYFIGRKDRKKFYEGFDKLRNIHFKVSQKVAIVEDYILIEKVLSNKKLSKEQKESLKNDLDRVSIEYKKVFRSN